MRLGMEEDVKRDGRPRFVWDQDQKPQLSLQKEALLTLSRAPTEFLGEISSVGSGFSTNSHGPYQGCWRQKQDWGTGIGFIRTTLSELKNVTYIGTEFLNFVHGLQTVDLSHMTQLTGIGANFLCGSDVATVLLPQCLKWVADSFMSSCAVKRVDLSHTAMERVGWWFLAGSSVEEVLLPPSLTRIGCAFLMGVRIKKIDLSETKVGVVGAKFLGEGSVEELLLPASFKRVGKVLDWVRIKDLSHTGITDSDGVFHELGWRASEVILPRTVDPSCFIAQCKEKKMDLSRTKIVQAGGGGGEAPDSVADGVEVTRLAEGVDAPATVLGALRREGEEGSQKESPSNQAKPSNKRGARRKRKRTD
jgi:hypothetical protein